jgi:hypothetical protein
MPKATQNTAQKTGINPGKVKKQQCGQKIQQHNRMNGPGTPIDFYHKNQYTKNNVKKQEYK